MEFTGCSLCLESTANNFVVLEECHKNMLQIIIPKMNWNDILNEKSKICQKCSENLQETYLFKSSCLSNNKKAELLEDLGEPLIMKSQMCRLCCQDTIYKDLKGRFKVDIQEMVNTCFPQLSLPLDDLNMCEICLSSLKDLDSFIKSCLKTGDNIKSYCSTMGINYKDFNVNEYFQRKKCFPISVENAEHGVVFNPSESVEETAVKNNCNSEENALELNKMDLPQKQANVEDLNTSKKNSLVQQVNPETSGQGNKLANKEPQFSQKFQCDKCDYAAEYKSALVSHMMKHRDPSKTKMHKCEICGHETKRIADLRWHMIIHKDPEEVKMYQCADCPYKTKRKADLKHHVIVHKSHMFKCALCSFETKNELYLNTTHMLCHKDISEVKSFKCESCPYQTKYKYHLKIHSQIHKDLSELKKYKCNWCDFETTHRQTIRIHQVIHKCRSELQLYKCNSCDYEGTRKADLRDHMLRHVVSDVTYECSKCSYKAKRKDYLRRHMDMHKDPSELRMYTCDLCALQTKRKGSLKCHLYTHVKSLQALKNKGKEIEDLMSKIHNL